MPTQTTRRDFLKSTSALAAAGTVLPHFAWSEKAFANDSPNARPRIGCIGVGSMVLEMLAATLDSVMSLPFAMSTHGTLIELRITTRSAKEKPTRTATTARFWNATTLTLSAL